MDAPNICFYCKIIIDSDDFLNCSVCKQNVHIKCLKRPGTPGDLLGDVFFTFTCIHCSTHGKEVFVREKLPWLMVVTLALYNLSITSRGLSHHGFFHRTHIMHYVDKNWNFLFDPAMKRKKKWTGTMTGVLSLNSPDFFISGQEVLRDSGWWKLTYNQTPKFYLKLYEQFSLKRQQLRNDRRNVEENNCSSEHSNSTSDETKRRRKDFDDEETCSRAIPYMRRKPKAVKFKEPKVEESKELSAVQSHLMDFLAENFSSNDVFDDLQSINTNSLLPIMKCEPEEETMLELLSPQAQNDDDDMEKHYNYTVPDSYLEHNEEQPEEDDFEEKYKPRIVQVTNFQQIENATKDPIHHEFVNIKEEPVSDTEEEEDQIEYECEKSLFTKNPKRELPWKDEIEEDNENGERHNKHDSRIEMLSEYDEKMLYRQLKDIINSEKDFNITIPPFIRRFYRKLCVRHLKRFNSIPIFNLDTFGMDNFSRRQKTEILDRYHMISETCIKENSGFYARITGSAHDELFESPFTSRILHPFIYRNTKCFPPWLKLMCELQYVVNDEVPSRATIDFCYVRPHHIAAVNGLLQKLFWHGIDMSECLSYPDFSVVALYKKLVVGCGFLVPDVTYNEAYISFMAVRPGWQRSGIATFMLYHLTQTCMGKDITLHVSATNPAICLYQKFGFKIEEVILDFYEKYFPVEETRQSRHAFFLRLKR